MYAIRSYYESPPSLTIVGADLTPGMLKIGQEKIAASPYRDRITLVTAPCEDMPHPDGQFDGVTIAFGIRNVVDRPAGLREMCRVLKPGRITSYNVCYTKLLRTPVRPGWCR